MTPRLAAQAAAPIKQKWIATVRDRRCKQPKTGAIRGKR